MRRPARFAVGTVGLAVSVLLTGCSGSPTPTPTPSAVPLRTIEVCAAAVAIPDETVGAVPDAALPPTTVLQVGGAMSFPVPAGARVGLLGVPEPAADAQLCTAPVATVPPTVPTEPSTEPSTTELVASGPGYVRLGIQVGTGPVAEVVVRVRP